MLDDRADRMEVLIPNVAVEELSRSFGTTDYLGAVQIFRAVRMLSHRMNEASADWLAPHQLTPAQYNFLAVLYLNGRKTGVSSRNVGRSLHTTSGTVTSMTDTLEQSGLLQREPHPTDRRSLVLKLTRKGERRFVEAAQTHHAQAVVAMRELTPEDVQTLIQLLVRAGNSLGTLLADPAETDKTAV